MKQIKGVYIVVSRLLLFCTIMLILQAAKQPLQNLKFSFLIGLALMVYQRMLHAREIAASKVAYYSVLYFPSLIRR